MTNKSLPSYLQETRIQNVDIKVEVEEPNSSAIFRVQQSKCRQLKKPFCYKINLQDCLCLFYDNKSIKPICDQSSEVCFESLDGICLTLALSYKCLIKIVKQKIVENRSNMGSFSFELPAVEHLGNSTGSPSFKWAFESVDTILRRKTLSKFPLFFQPVSPRVVFKPAFGPCSDEVSELPSNSTSYTTMSENSEAKDCHNRVFSSSSASSSSSYNSGPCAGCFTTSAVLYCVWDGNIPTFLFSVDDGRSELLVASPTKVNSSVDRALDYVYTFHSVKLNRKKSLNNASRYPHFIGRMKVSSCLSLDSVRTKCVETRFVLFGSQEDNPSECRNSPSNFRIGNGLSRMVTEIFRPSNSPRHQHGQNAKVSSQFEVLQELLRNKSSEHDGIDKENYFAENFRPNDELVAIVMKDYRRESINQVAFGGWGLKFLQKVELHDDKLSEEFVGSSKTVNVIVPAGYHGGQMTESGGPSTILERWKSRGCCDCGGWDTGCPLTILHNSSNSKILGIQDSSGDSAFELFIEGSKQDEPAMKLVNMRGDVYQTFFQSNLSALQCFAIAVAIIHSRTPALSPEL